MSVLEITEDNFEELVINSGKTCVVDMFATWCGPCKMMSPIIDEIAEENGDIVVGKVDVDENGELAMQFGVMSIPTILIFKNGELAETFVGLQSKETILNAVQ
jgi:thioredoxin 1